MTKLSVLAVLAIFSVLTGCAEPAGEAADAAASSAALSAERAEIVLVAPVASGIAADVGVRPSDGLTFYGCKAVYECRFPDGRVASLRLSAGPDCTFDGYERFVPYREIGEAAGVDVSAADDARTTMNALAITCTRVDE